MHLSGIRLLHKPILNSFPCKAGDPNVGLIANLGSVDDPVKLRKQRLGSSLKGFPRYVTQADLYGWLVHTPLLVPAVFGTVVAY
jgi:hypothetical protein